MAKCGKGHSFIFETAKRFSHYLFFLSALCNKLTEEHKHYIRANILPNARKGGKKGIYK